MAVVAVETTPFTVVQGCYQPIAALPTRRSARRLSRADRGGVDWLEAEFEGGRVGLETVVVLGRVDKPGVGDDRVLIVAFGLPLRESELPAGQDNLQVSASGRLLWGGGRLACGGVEVDVPVARDDRPADVLGPIVEEVERP